jgi:phage terminase large subunit-like protein
MVRLGEHPKILATTTPKRTPAVMDLFEEHEKNPEKILIIRGSMYDNLANLPESFIDSVSGKYLNTNIASQEIFGLLLDPEEGALWDQQIIEDHRWLSDSPWRRLPVRCVALDPSVAERPKDEAGIIVVGATGNRELHKRHAYVLEDASLLGSPDEWAARAVEMAKKYSCPIVAEGTQGQALVANMIRSIDPSIKVFLVQTGKRGKIERAEPVTLPYQQGRVHHVGHFEDLELQLTTYSAENSKKSPDRMDALVHGLTALLIKPPQGFGGGSLKISSTRNRRLSSGGRGTGRTWRDGTSK